ncbi:BspA family leucine-rich repeat surface protein [Flagellimonas sp.]|uniref:BspA family leucine-rich repeat surface protein n=1 Tax=Flagellimonas sp. TaxID=2058762 RepID=UPI003BACD7EC
MKLKKLLYTALFALMVVSCGKDDAPKPPIDKNNAPQIEGKTFNVNENITDAHVIGTVVASDDDDDDLEFSISTNDNGLFEIGATDGKLSLAANKSLDYASKQQHTITVSVSDGELSANANMTINVTEAEQTNQPPTYDETEYSFSASEDILDTDIIGSISATDNDGDDLTYEIVQNDNGLFEINTVSGEISLAEGMDLDFETAQQHTFTVSVTDNVNDLVEVQVTITVTDVAEAHPDDKAAFVTTWEIQNTGDNVILNLDPEYSYDFTINWGDGTVEELSPENPTTINHNYATAGIYKVAIVGTFPSFSMVEDNAVADQLIRMDQWGTTVWQKLAHAFYNCKNMMYYAMDVPDLTNVESLSYMFRGASSFNADLNGWNVSNVKYMNYMFAYAAEFNSNLDQWNVANAITMEAMFNFASKFNGNIDNWKVGNVTNMYAMFSNASEFNRDISDWETGKVTNMFAMFAYTPFDHDISGWDTAKVTVMSLMFLGAGNFDQNLGDWDIGSITGMIQMFNSAGMSALNYGSTLIGWSQKISKPQNITLGAVNIPYCQDDAIVQDARDILVNFDGWNILGDDAVECGI